MKSHQGGLIAYPNPGPEGCSGGTSRDLSSHWVIVDGPSASPTEYGLLTLDPATSGDRLWKLTSCDGQSISEGLVWRTSCTLLLLPPKDVDACFAWPAVDEAAQGAALIKRSGLASYVTLRLLNLLEQHDPWAYEGAHCPSASNDRRMSMGCAYTKMRVDAGSISELRAHG